MILLACIFSVIERTLRCYTWINSLDKILDISQNTSYQILIQLFYSCLILLVRYYICSKRHIYAHKYGITCRNKILKNIQKRCILETNIYQLNSDKLTTITHYIEESGQLTQESKSRIARDLIPGITSVIIGIFQLWFYLNSMIFVYVILYLFVLQFLYIFLSEKITYQEKKFDKTIRTCEAKMYCSLRESIESSLLVGKFKRTQYEFDRFNKYINSTTHNELERVKLFNVQDCIVKWMSQCVYIGVIVISKGFVKNPTHILWILYFAQEVRNGCEEIYTFFKVKNKWTIINNEISKFITEHLADNNLNYTIADRVTLQNISINYDSNKLLENISFSRNMFTPDNYTILMGNNGSGKSSLCKILEGTSGHLSLSNSSKFELPLKESIISCQQRTILFESKSVLYNLMYVTPYIFDSNYELFKEAFVNDINKFNLDAILEKPVYKLSGGERQKICLLRAYIYSQYNNINLLLLDEWDSALDNYSKCVGFEFIEKIRTKTSCAIIWVSHRQINQLMNNSSAKGILIKEKKIIENSYNKIYNLYIKCN